MPYSGGIAGANARYAAQSTTPGDLAWRIVEAWLNRPNKTDILASIAQDFDYPGGGLILVRLDNRQTYSIEVKEIK